MSWGLSAKSSLVHLVSSVYGKVFYYLMHLLPSCGPVERWSFKFKLVDTWCKESVSAHTIFILIYNSLASFLWVVAYATKHNLFDTTREDKRSLGFDSSLSRNARERLVVLSVLKRAEEAIETSVEIVINVDYCLPSMANRVRWMLIHGPDLSDGILLIASNFSIVWANRMERKDAGRLGVLS